MPTSEIGTMHLQMTRDQSPMCPIFGGSTAHIITIVLVSTEVAKRQNDETRTLLEKEAELVRFQQRDLHQRGEVRGSPGNNVAMATTSYCIIELALC